jgi:ribose transport system substrate-binding protein
VIRTFTARRVDGMSISVIDANAVRDAINAAVDAGIPVITFDSDCPGSKRRTFYAVSDDAVGNSWRGSSWPR